MSSDKHNKSPELSDDEVKRREKALQWFRDNLPKAPTFRELNYNFYNKKT